MFALGVLLLAGLLAGGCDLASFTTGEEPQPMVEAVKTSLPATSDEAPAPLSEEGIATRRVRVVTPDPELENQDFYARLAEESLDRLLGGSGDALLGDRRLVVVVSPTPRDFAQRTTMSPDSALAVAFPSRGHIVLNAAKLRQFDPLERIRTLDHEMVHVLLGRIAAGEAHVPLWLHEGLAQDLSGQSSMTDMVRLALANITDRRIPMTQLIDSFPYGSPGAPVAYAQALSFTRFVATDFFSFADSAALFHFLVANPERAKTILAILSDRNTIEELDHRWYKKRERGDSWLLVVTSSSVLWIGIVFLFLGAYGWKKRRERQVIAGWDPWERDDHVEETEPYQNTVSDEKDADDIVFVEIVSDDTEAEDDESGR